MISLKVNVYADEIVATLSAKRQRLQRVLDRKMNEAVEDTVALLVHGLPGKYLDPKTIQSGVQGLGSQTIVGFVEATDKGGIYNIYPVKAKALRFIAKSGDIVFTGHVRRPYLKTSKFVEEHLLELKPWIEQQLTEAIEDAL